MIKQTKLMLKLLVVILAAGVVYSIPLATSSVGATLFSEGLAADSGGQAQNPGNPCSKKNQTQNPCNPCGKKKKG